MIKHKPRKRFGQNFLIDEGIIQNIISSISIDKNDHIVEIGPGLGALTNKIELLCNKLDIIEIDNDLAKELNIYYQKNTNVTVFNADALKFNFDTLSTTNDKMRIVGNLPYNISTELLFHLFNSSKYIKDMHFMLQKEVVDRLEAIPKTKNYGKLSVMAQYYCQIKGLFEVPQNAFKPAPKVLSRIVRIVPYKELPIKCDDVTYMKKIVTSGFNQRRKTILNSLKGHISGNELLNLDIDPKLRAEALSVQDFVNITNFIINNRHD